MNSEEAKRLCATVLDNTDTAMRDAIAELDKSGSLDTELYALQLETLRGLIANTKDKIMFDI